MLGKKSKQKSAEADASKAASPRIAGLNELIKSTISDYKANWQKFFWLLIAPLALSFIVTVVFDVIETYYAAIPGAALFAIVILSIAAFIFFAVLYVWAFIAEIRLLDDLTQDVSRGDVFKRYKEGRPLFWRIVAISVIYLFLAFLFSLCFIVPGVIFMVSYCFAMYFAVLGGDELEAAFGKSRDLVKGYWWPVFGRIVGGIAAMYLVYFLIVLALSLFRMFLQSIMHLPISADLARWAYDLLSLFAGLVFGPLSLIYMFRIFKELKAVKK